VDLIGSSAGDEMEGKLGVVGSGQWAICSWLGVGWLVEGGREGVLGIKMGIFGR